VETDSAEEEARGPRAGTTCRASHLAEHLAHESSAWEPQEAQVPVDESGGQPSELGEAVGQSVVPPLPGAWDRLISIDEAKRTSDGGVAIKFASLMRGSHDPELAGPPGTSVLWVPGRASVSVGAAL